MQSAMAVADTSVRVSRQTLTELERLREVFHTRSADETILKLVRERRARALNWILGSGQGAISKFREEDRLESHDSLLCVD
ncbi:MAG: hypothetical protein ACHQ2Y_02635 [Candidatus Lutacidiplasmatales archaeon]